MTEEDRRVRREQMRYQAVECFAHGHNRSQVARYLGVSRTAASRWYRRWLRGASMARSYAIGAPRKVNQSRLISLLRTVSSHNNPLTAHEARDAVTEITGVTYSEAHICRFMNANGIPKICEWEKRYRA